MDALLNIVLWGGLFFLMMRFGCGSHGASHGKKQSTAENPNQGAQSHLAAPAHRGIEQRQEADTTDLRWIAPQQDKDPVCGRNVKTESAKSTIHDGKVYYFCTRDCREIFEAGPDLYVGNDHSNQKSMEHSHA